jgi:hypothetical protein
MTYINRNSETTQGMRKALKLDELQGAPFVVPNSITPTVEVNPMIIKPAFIKSATAANLSGNNVIYATPTTQDFYLCSAAVAQIKDVTADTVTLLLRCTINGLLTDILVLVGITLTAQDRYLNINFPHPIKIDRGTNIFLRRNIAKWQLKRKQKKKQRVLK